MAMKKVTEAHVYKAKNKLELDCVTEAISDAAHTIQAGPDVHIDKRGAIGRKAHHW